MANDAHDGPTGDQREGAQLQAIEDKLHELWAREVKLNERESGLAKREERVATAETAINRLEAKLGKNRHVEKHLRSEIDSLQESNAQLEENLREITESLTFRIGVELRESLLHPGMRTLKMPFRILGMVKRGK